MDKGLLKCSNFFAPNFDKSIQISEYIKSDSKWNAYTDSEDGDSDEVTGWSGIADWRAQNQNYTELKVRLGLDGMTNFEIIKWIKSKLIQYMPSRAKPSTFQQPLPFFPALPPQKITDVIFQMQFEGRSKEWIFEKLGVSFKQIREAEKWYKLKVKDWIKLQRSTVSMNKRKLQVEHIAQIENFLEEKKGAAITIKMIKEHLINNFPDLWKISDFTIRSALKKDMKYSYKKLSKRKQITKMDDRVRLYYESIAIQIWLEDQGIELIYWDEFTVSTRNYTYYGWAPQNSRGFLYSFNDEAKFNILIGFSGLRFYGVIVSNENTDKYLVIRFLRRLIEVRRNRYKIIQNNFIIVMDNF